MADCKGRTLRSRVACSVWLCPRMGRIFLVLLSGYLRQSAHEFPRYTGKLSPNSYYFWSFQILNVHKLKQKHFWGNNQNNDINNKPNRRQLRNMGTSEGETNKQKMLRSYMKGSEISCRQAQVNCGLERVKGSVVEQQEEVLGFLYPVFNTSSWPQGPEAGRWVPAIYLLLLTCFLGNINS